MRRWPIWVTTEAETKPTLRRLQPPGFTPPPLVLKELPQPQVCSALGFLTVKPRPIMLSTKSISAPTIMWALELSTKMSTPRDSSTMSVGSGARAMAMAYWFPAQPPPMTATLSAP